MDEKLKISIVEDSSKIRETFTELVNSHSAFEFISAYETAEDALKNIPSDKPDIVLMDINLPGKSGIDCTRKLKKIMKSVQIMIITVYEDSQLVFEALSAGANGYILKRTAPSEIINSIIDLHNGGSPMSPQIARMVVQSFQKKIKNEDEINSLTEREREILSYLARGYRYKEIGEALFISTETVRGHLRNIYQKLQVRSATQALLKYMGKNPE